MKTKNVPKGLKCKINDNFFLRIRGSQKGGWGGVGSATWEKFPNNTVIFFDCVPYEDQKAIGGHDLRDQKRDLCKELRLHILRLINASAPTECFFELMRGKWALSPVTDFNRLCTLESVNRCNSAQCRKALKPCTQWRKPSKSCAHWKESIGCAHWRKYKTACAHWRKS